MSPEDARHGSHRGYVVGCRLTCCTAAHTRYMKLYRMGRIPRLIDSTGTVRRIQALQTLGWSYAEMGQRGGRTENWAYMITRRALVTTTTAARIAKVYAELCMVIPAGGYAERTRALARRKGWPPPLAWTNIDDPDEAPTGWEYRVHDTPNQSTVDPPIDPVVIARILAGEVVSATTAERREVVRRWAEAGRVLNELGRLTGWKIERYYRAGEAA